MTDTWGDDVLGGDTMFVGNYHSDVLVGKNRSCHVSTTNTYSIGDIYMYNGDAFRNSKYLLCQTSSKKVALIHLWYAKIWKPAVKVKDFYAITKDEFMEIVGGEAMFNNFYLILGEMKDDIKSSR